MRCKDRQEKWGRDWSKTRTYTYIFSFGLVQLGFVGQIRRSIHLQNPFEMSSLSVKQVIRSPLQKRTNNVFVNYGEVGNKSCLVIFFIGIPLAGQGAREGSPTHNEYRVKLTTKIASLINN